MSYRASRAYSRQRGLSIFYYLLLAAIFPPCLVVAGLCERVVYTQVGIVSLATYQAFLDLPMQSQRIVEAVMRGDRDLPEWVNRSEYVRNSLLLNHEALVNVQRKDGVAYLDHPVRLALLLEMQLPATYQNRARAQSASLMHDYLEEGPGISVASVRHLRGRVSEVSEEGFLSAFFLTEPQINYSNVLPLVRIRIPEGQERRVLEKISYSLQVAEILGALRQAGRGDRAEVLANTVLADKTVNALDYNYIFLAYNSGSMSRAEMQQQIGTVIASSLLAMDSLGGLGAIQLRSGLESALMHLAERAQLTRRQIVDAYLRLRETQDLVRDPVLTELRRYHEEYRVLWSDLVH